MAVAAPAMTDGSGLSRLWDRELHRYPANGKRYLSLAIVILTTIVLYYELYLAGAVATSILSNLHMSFVFYVNIAVVGYVFGAAAAIAAGIADRYGRANIVTAGLALTGVLCLVGLPNAHSKWSFAIIYIAIGFVEGIVLVATPALIRDFSPQLGRASAMGFWTLGPVLGSLVVSIVVTNTTNHYHQVWQDQYIICGIVGLVIFLISLVGLRELSPQLRDQLMVSSKDRVLIEARAAGIDVEASLKKPFSQMMRLDIVGSAFAISVFLIFYYIAVGFFPVFFQTVFGYSQSEANGLGNWFWSFDAGSLLVIGVISDWARVRKPFMVLGALSAAAATAVFAVKANDLPNASGVGGTSHGTFVVLLIWISVSLGLAFAPWMASFTETVERHNPALTATGLATWGLIIRVVIAVSVFFVPKVVTDASPLVDQVPPLLTNTTPVQTTAGTTTIGAVLTALKDNPAVATQLTVINTRDAALLAALKANPQVVAALAEQAKSGATPTATQLSFLKATIGAPAFAELTGPNGTPDLTYLSTTAPKTLGAANFAAISAPTPALGAAVIKLTSLAATQAPSAKQWQKYWWISLGGELVFIPLIFLMAGFWDPRKAKEAEEEHERMIERELAALGEDRAPV